MAFHGQNFPLGPKLNFIYIFCWVPKQI